MKMWFRIFAIMQIRNSRFPDSLFNTVDMLIPLIKACCTHQTRQRLLLLIKRNILILRLHANCTRKAYRQPNNRLKHSKSRESRVGREGGGIHHFNWDEITPACADRTCALYLRVRSISSSLHARWLVIWAINGANKSAPTTSLCTSRRCDHKNLRALNSIPNWSWSSCFPNCRALPIKHTNKYTHKPDRKVVLCDFLCVCVCLCARYIALTRLDTWYLATCVVRNRQRCILIQLEAERNANRGV